MAAQGAQTAGSDPVLPRAPRVGAQGASHEAVEVRRSARRRRTVTAFRDGGTLVVCIPAGFSSAQERLWVDRMVTRLQAQDQRRRPSDEALARRAAELYGDVATWSSIAGPETGLS